MQSKELSLELTAQSLDDPGAGATELIEFDDLNSITLPSTLPANDSLTLDDALEVEIDLEGAVEIELAGGDVDNLLNESGNS